jgi:SAM-dependent methyltransferase
MDHRLKGTIKRIWRMIQPASVVAARMQRDWDDRARQNARYFVATLKEDWNDEEFFGSGRTWIRLYVLPDLSLICGSRSASDLRMLELGCGAGRMTRGFSEMFGQVDAVDVSPDMIAKARSVLSDCRNVSFHVTDGMTLSMFDDLNFDFIFSAIVFQHIPRKSIIRNYIKEASRLLRPGCVFKFQVHGIPIKRRHTDTWLGVGFSESELHEVAKQCGFTIHESTGAGTQYFWLTLVKR